VFIVLVIIGFGLLSILNSGSLTDGSPLARGFCAFVSLFWLLRLILQLFVIDAKPLLSNAFLCAGYHGLTLVFVYFSAVYGYVAVQIQA